MLPLQQDVLAPLQGDLPCKSVSMLIMQGKTQLLMGMLVSSIACKTTSCCMGANQAVLQINGSLARAAIRELADKGAIKPVVNHSRQKIYTRSTG